MTPQNLIALLRRPDPRTAEASFDAEVFFDELDAEDASLLRLVAAVAAALAALAMTAALLA